MGELEHKYKTNNLTSEELVRLRNKVNFLSDSELAAQLQDEWMNDEIDTSAIESKRLDRLKEQIDLSIGRERTRVPLFRKISQIAAAVLLPVFVITTFYFYRETRQLGSEEMAVTTGKGERASITLPDGTTVSLNSESRLTYTPKIYNKTVRQIDFDGEGYFQVHKDAKRPFQIRAKGLNVKVLGTVFNLRARKSGDVAELTLEEGCVQFYSTKTDKNVVLNLGSKAILDQKTGNITVVKEKNIENGSSWKRGSLEFHETRLSDVIKDIENSYGVKIAIRNTSLSDQFTGSIPVANLNEALLILEKSYHLKCSRNGRNIVLSNIPE